MSADLAFAQSMRSEDHFHPGQDARLLMGAFFPADPGELATDLSKVTSLFYGLLLQVMSEQMGAHAVDRASRALFYRLGRAKTRATRAQHASTPIFHGDVRDLVALLISAIYNASPEYVFHVEHYDERLCSVRLSGVDRYYRAAESLGLVDQLTWPTLHPFFEGIRDELGIDCDVRSELLQRHSDARLVTRYTFQMRGV
ncbi:MAG: hypothetical protein QM778_23530 [Myxococcales bacterium]